MLFKNAEAIELLRKVDTLVVDKTGTLTEGKPRLVAVVPAGGVDETTLLRLAASLERGSEHPLAAAIVAGADERGVAARRRRATSSRVTGKGVAGTRRRPQRSRSATARCWSELGVDAGDAGGRGRGAARARAQTVMFVAVDGRLAGPARRRRSDQGQRRRRRIRALHAEGLRIVMLTGDSRDDGRGRRAQARHRRGRSPRCCPSRRPTW